MVNPNQNSPTPEPFDPNEARREAFENGGGNAYMAQERFGGAPDGQPGLPFGSPMTSPGTQDTGRHYSRRGGRSYPERSGRDVTREFDNATPPVQLSDEERTRVEDSKATIRRQLAALHVTEIMDKNPGDIGRQQALIRTYTERRGRS